MADKLFRRRARGAFQGDAAGHIAISYTAPASGAAAGIDTITAANLPAAATATASDSYRYSPLGSRAGLHRSTRQGIPCATARTTRQLHFPRDRRRAPERYRLTVTAVGAAGTVPATAQATVLVRGGAGQAIRPARRPYLALLLLLGLTAAGRPAR